jgi:hypothetical protein
MAFRIQSGPPLRVHISSRYGTKAEGVFTSHVGEEKLLAARIKDLMREVFGAA